MGLVGGVLGITLASCGQASTSSTNNHPNATIAMNFTWSGALDPSHNFGSVTPAFVEMYLYDRLVDLNPAGKVVGNLASSWTVTPNSVTFKLKSGPTCYDGSAINAKVVAASLQRTDDMSVASPTMNETGFYWGYDKHTITYDATANTVTVSTENPYSGLLYGFTSGIMGIECGAGLKPGADYQNHSYGSGEYTMVSDNADSTLVFKLRPQWSWGSDGATASAPGVPGQITFTLITDSTTAANALLTGQVNATIVQGADQARVAADSSLKEIAGTSTYATELLFNEDPARVGSDQAVRQALLTAVDPKAWNQIATNGTGVLANGLFNSTMACYQDESALVPKTDVSAAKQILASDGWTMASNGKLAKGGKELTITLLSQLPVPQASLDYLAGVWDQLGVNTIEKSEDSTTFNADSGSGNWDVRNGTFSTSGTPYPTTISPWWNGQATHTSAGGLTRAAVPALVDDYKQGDTTLSCAPWQDLQQQLLTGYHMLPLIYPKIIWYASKGLTFVPTPQPSQLDNGTLHFAS